MAKLSPFPSPMPYVALSILIPLFSSFSFSFSTGSIGDLLQEHGLPAGLLPKAVESFAHDPSSGLLEVLIGRPCYAWYEDGLSFFDREVRGNLSYGALQGVVGWSQEELFLWLPVKEIVIADSDSGVILFDIGVAHKRLPVSSFEDPPDCLPGAEEAAVEAGLGSFVRKGFQQQR
ncbi:uncharacterized protein LOC122049357 [Zingiber officinale]|nr:uncharacterized protein LOC122049357 [Zingiber officinale]XP_042466685.1 uncharacterized protein LOC122049357 [Zingiber officinale]